jgi:hypothetical protein
MKYSACCGDFLGNRRELPEQSPKATRQVRAIPSEGSGTSRKLRRDCSPVRIDSPEHPGDPRQTRAASALVTEASSGSHASSPTGHGRQCNRPAGFLGKRPGSIENLRVILRPLTPASALVPGASAEAPELSTLVIEASSGSYGRFSDWSPRARQQAREIPREASGVDRESPRDSSSTQQHFRVSSRSFLGKPASLLRWSSRLLREGCRASPTAHADFRGKRSRFPGNLSELIEKCGEIPRQHPRDSRRMRRACEGSSGASWRSTQDQPEKHRGAVGEAAETNSGSTGPSSTIPKT